jgi:hypothetical protein
MDERPLVPKRTQRLLRRSAVLSRRSSCSSCRRGPPYLLPVCRPQMHGIGECLVGAVNLAPFLLSATMAGLFFAVLAVVCAAAPLLAIAWWLEQAGRPLRRTLGGP